MLDIQLTQQLKTASGQAFTIYGDDSNSDMWYVVPIPVIAIDPNTNNPLFSLVQYNLSGGVVTGFCNFTVWLQPSTAQVTALRAAIPGAVLGQFDWLSATPALSYQNSAGAQTAYAAPSGYGNQAVSFSIQLPDQPSVQLFAAAFGPSAPAAGLFSVTYDLSAQTRLPAVNVVATYDSSIAVNYAVTQHYSTDIWGNHYDEYTTIQETLTQSGAGTVVVTPGAGITQELLAMVTDWANAQLQQDVQTAVDSALALIGGQNPGQSFTVSDIGSFTNTFSSTNVVSWYFQTESMLPQITSNPTTWTTTYFTTVNAQTLDVDFTVQANLAALGIKTVTLTVNYPTIVGGVTYTYEATTAGTFHVHAPGSVQNGAFSPIYTYNYTVVFLDSSFSSVVSGQITASATTVNLSPANLGVMQVTFTAQNINFTGGSTPPTGTTAVKDVNVTLSWVPTNSSVPQQQTVVLSNGIQSQSVLFHSTLPSTSNTYAYSLRFDMANGTTLNAGLVQNNNPTVYIDNPFQTLTVNPFVVGSGFSMVLLNATFDDLINNIHTNNSWQGQPTTNGGVIQLAGWSFPTVTANTNATTVTFSGVLVDAKGQQHQFGPTIMPTSQTYTISSTQTWFTLVLDASLVSYVAPGAAGVYNATTQVSLSPPTTSPNPPPPCQFISPNTTFAFVAGGPQQQYYSQLVAAGATPTYYYSTNYMQGNGTSDYDPGTNWGSTTAAKLTLKPNGSTPPLMATRMMALAHGPARQLPASTQTILKQHHAFVAKKHR
jgi:hypothetical protein